MSSFAAFTKQRQVHRSIPNPMDKSTIVSVLPKQIEQINHTIQPGRFIIPPGRPDNPSILVVGTSSWWKDVDLDQPLLEIPVSSVAIAQSIVRDYCNGILGCDMGGSMPGLFSVLGAKTAVEIQVDHKAELDLAISKQRNWFQILVRMADALWSRSNGNPLSIGEDMRLAAAELNITGKEWQKDFATIELVRCVACGQLNNNKIIICPNCKVIINKAEFDKLKLSFAS